MKRAICLMTLSTAALFAGCGDDDSAPETPVTTPTVEEAPSQLSKEQFIAAGDGICAEVNAALGSLSETSSSSSSVAGQRADLYEGMVDRLRDLGAPDEAAIDEFFDAADDLAAAEEEAADASEDGDDTALAAAQSEAATAGEDFAEAASSYGFEDCGQGATSVTSPTAPTTAAPVVPAEPVPTTPAVPVAPEPDPGSTGAGGGTAGDTGGGTGSGGTSGSGGVGPG